MYIEKQGIFYPKIVYKSHIFLHVFRRILDFPTGVWSNSPLQYAGWSPAGHSLVSFAWWRNQMETFSASLAICAGNSPVPGEFPAQRPVTRSFDVFFDLRLHKRLSKQPWGWWFETPAWSLWRHRNGSFPWHSGETDEANCSWLHQSHQCASATKLYQRRSVAAMFVIWCEIFLIWKSLNTIDGNLILVQVMAWCRQAACYYFRQCWPSSRSPWSVTKGQGVLWIQIAGKWMRTF